MKKNLIDILCISSGSAVLQLRLFLVYSYMIILHVYYGIHDHILLVITFQLSHRSSPHCPNWLAGPCPVPAGVIITPILLPSLRLLNWFSKLGRSHDPRSTTLRFRSTEAPPSRLQIYKLTTFAPRNRRYPNPMISRQSRHAV